MSQNSKTRIKATDYSAQLFDPLIQINPRLHAVVELVRVNGKVIEHLHQQACTMEGVCRLEANIGRACSSVTSACRQFHSESSEARFEILVRIHMFWYVHILPTTMSF